MKKVIKIDANGMFVEDVILEDRDLTPSDCVEVDCPEGFYHPKWDAINKVWVEGMSATDIAASKAIVSPKTNKQVIQDLQTKIDKMQVAINKLLGL